VREVLTRGLASEPAARWPDMHALLRELDTALVPSPSPRTRWRRAKTSAPIAIAVIAAVFLFFRPHAGSNAPGAAASSVNDDCASGKAAFLDTWNQAKHAAASAKKSSVQRYAVPGMLDSVREQWLKLHDHACATKNADDRDAQLSCLHEVRDDLKELAGGSDEDGQLTLDALIPLSIQLATCKHEHDD
jgi:hypothetical protein